MIAAPSNTEGDRSSNILAELSKVGYELVKRDPFTSVGLTPPVFTVAFEDGPAGHISVTFTHVPTSRVFRVPAAEHRILFINGRGYRLDGSGTWDSLTDPSVSENAEQPPALKHSQQPLTVHPLVVGQQVTVKQAVPHANNPTELLAVPGDRLTIVTMRHNSKYVRVRCPDTGYDSWLSLDQLVPYPAEDLDRVGKLAARVSELEADAVRYSELDADWRAMSDRLARIEHWLDREDHGWQGV
jgi:hypothetical protein